MSINPIFADYAGLDLTPYILVSLLALGMALAFVSADRQSPTSRALALALAFIGMSVDLGIVVGVQYPLPHRVIGLFGWSEALAIVFLMEWIMRVRRTVPAGALDTKFGDRLVRVGQAAGLLYGVLSTLLPEVRNRQFLGALAQPDAYRHYGFWLFLVPILLAAACGAASILLMLNRRPDRAERTRVTAMVAAIPFMSGSLVVGLHYSAILMVIGLLLLLVGATQYHVLQGQRGQFMSRFLSPQVARLVSERGLATAMQENHLEITVVCCDLRGFTAYAQAHPSARVLQVLREYYDAVGQCAAEAGATIKDFAGDGVLLLVGAPLPEPRHAAIGVDLARRIRSAARGVTARAAEGAGPRLGIGVGVASGYVTVGVIASSGRFEYTAVGPAVNLASRLCQCAADGEVLVAAATVEQSAQPSGEPRLEPRKPVEVKGYAEPVPHFNVGETPGLATAA
ncbi:MAG TPA: adenylate/guanylate cyclase domain-containing protein [Candidatus Binatia bacterium]|nr:adenylate/guanylate cyclase domain-containing protein [Candidatus Binatia bacterium]